MPPHDTAWNHVIPLETTCMSLLPNPHPKTRYAKEYSTLIEQIEKCMVKEVTKKVRGM